MQFSTLWDEIRNQYFRFGRAKKLCQHYLIDYRCIYAPFILVQHIPDKSTNINTSEGEKVLVSTFDSHNSMQLRFLLQQWTACANNAKKKEQNAKRTKRRTGMNETKKTFAHSWSTLEGACYAMGKSVAATHNSQHMNWVFFFCFVSLFPSFYSFSSLPPTCIETLLFFCTALGFCSSVFWSHWWKPSSFYNRFFMIFCNAA